MHEACGCRKEQFCRAVTVSIDEGRATTAIPHTVIYTHNVTPPAKISDLLDFRRQGRFDKSTCNER
jgi:hypothetical protein